MLRRVFGVGAVLSTASLAILLVNCFSDDRAEEPVKVLSDCDVARLSVDPASPEATVKVFVETADALKTAADALTKQYVDLCNVVNGELGASAGADIATACQPINQRASIIRKRQPPNSAPLPIRWFNLAAPPTCTVDSNVTAQCLATCGAPCDLSKCTGATTGSCPGTCVGTCATVGKGACVGSCRGECEPYLLDFCVGECQGSCTSGNYEAECAGGCDTDFNGTCGGTCTGTCDGNPINVVDGGADAGSQAPPSNADGNCTGLCKGVCSSKASGACGNSCSGKYSGGLCLGLCTGNCISGGGSGCAKSQYAQPNAPAPACDGTCVQATGDAGAPCAGQCEGTCSQPFASGACSGQLDCKQNRECDLACSAKAQLEAKCAPPSQFETATLSDPPLYAIMKKHGAEFLTLAGQSNAFRTAAGLIKQRSITDFDAIGAKGEHVRACVARGAASADAASAALTAISNADVTISH